MNRLPWLAARLALVLIAITPTLAGAQNIRTIAGGGGTGPAAALSVPFDNPTTVLYAPSGKIYFGVYDAVYVFDPLSNTVSRVAGYGSAGFGGDGSAATAAAMGNPTGLALDALGSLYIADPGNARIRRVDATSGVITTVVGNGTVGLSPDGTVAASASVSEPNGIAIDAAGNLYFSETGNNVVRRVAPGPDGSYATGTLTTVVGDGVGATAGYSGDGGVASAATLSSPAGIAFDQFGWLYVADTGNHVIRTVTPPANGSIITTLAGNGTAGYGGDGGPATSAMLNAPVAVAIDAGGNVYLADRANQVVRVVTPTGDIFAIAGNGTAAFAGDNGPAGLASVSNPGGVAVDAAGNVYVADAGNNRLRVVRPTSAGIFGVLGGVGTIGTAAGNGTAGFGGDGGAALQAFLFNPNRVALDAAGNLYIADLYNHAIRKVTPAGTVSTVAGIGGSSGYNGDGIAATSAQLNFPMDVAVDAAGNLYIADTINSRIRRVDAQTGLIATVAGTGTFGFAGDGGSASVAQLSYPDSVAVDSAGNVYLADTSNNRVRRIDAATQAIATIAGGGNGGDGGPATNASLNFPTAVAVDSAGNVYIADSLDATVRRVTPPGPGGGLISTVAGNGTAGFGGDGGPAAAASLANPTGLALDGNGNLYVADSGNDVVRIVSAVASGSARIFTVAGTAGVRGLGGDGGPATSAVLNGPGGVAVDGAGTLYIADEGNDRVRAVPGAGVPADATPPVIQSTITGTLSPSGWYTSAVTVSWSVTDAQSAVTSSSGCGTVTVSTDTAGLTLTCTATSAGGTASQSVTLKVDVTAPVASTVVTPVANGAGWQHSAVSVTFVGSDATSGIASCSPPVVVATEGANQTSAPGTCADGAGNVSLPVAASHLNIDRTPPAVSGLALPPPNAVGWNSAPVIVTFVASDALSGVLLGSCTPPVPLSVNGAGLAVAGQCSDLAGNVGAAVVGPINIDSVPPVAAATASPPPNAAGWNNSPVTVGFTGTDSLPGSGIAGCTPALVLAADGANQSAVGTCTDVAGNVSTPVTATGLNIDRTPPLIGISSPAPAGVYATGSTLIASYACSDALSGVAPGSCSGTLPNGATIDTSVAGSRTFTATATDLAGNTGTATNTYSVSPYTLTTPGTIWTYAGNGTYGLSGDAGAATSAEVAFPSGLAVDAAGNLFIADELNGRIRRVDVLTQTITTYAGIGSDPATIPPNNGDGGPATSAWLPAPYYIAVDATGTVYFANQTIDSGLAGRAPGVRAIKPDGTVGLFAGGGTGGDGGPAATASLGFVRGLAVDGLGNLYIAEGTGAGSVCCDDIRRVDSSGTITTVAAALFGATTDGAPSLPTSAWNILALAADASGNLYVSLAYSGGGTGYVRRVDPLGKVTTVAGNGVFAPPASIAGDGSPATTVSLTPPLTLAVDAAGAVYFDGYNGSLRKVDSNGILATVAGAGSGSVFSGDGLMAEAAVLVGQEHLAVDSSGNLFVAEAAAPCSAGPCAGANNRVQRVVAVAAPINGPAAVAARVVGTVGLNNWYTSDVGVSWSISNALPSSTSAAGCAPTTITTDTSGQVVGCVVTTPGGATAASQSVKRDATPPVTAVVAAPLPDAFGWNNTPVAVTYSGTDATSGVAACSPATILSIEGANLAAGAGSCTDNAGNSSTTVSGPAVSIDRTAPLVTASLNATANAAGWFRAPVTVTFTGTDALSGLAANACAAAITLSGDGAGQTATGSCTDKAANVGSATASGINIDRTPPVVTTSRSPAANVAGWTNTNVTVSFACTDALSGSGVASCPAAVLIATEGANQSASGSASDVAGNTATATQTAINVDKTAPVATIAVPANGASYALNAAVTASYSCADALSGVASCLGPVSSGTAISTATAGSFSFAVSATDLAGNAATTTSTYRVSSATGPAYTLSTASLGFGSEALYVASGAQVVTVTNVGTVAVPINAVSLSGANANQFARSSTCGPSLAVSAVCTVTVTFRPTSVGAKSATLSVVAGGAAGTQTVALSGTGVAASYALSAQSLSFGGSALNVATAAQLVTLTNTGLVPVPISSLALGGNNPGQFRESNTCGTAVAVSCTITVVFDPTSAGTKSATVTVSAGSGGGTQAITLTGIGLVPTFTLSPKQLAFGTQARGTSSAAQVVTLNVTGTLPLAITSIGFSGTNPGQFRQTNSCGSSVAAGGSCTISVLFRPTSTGAKSASLRVTGAGGSQAQTVTLTGTGL